MAKKKQGFQGQQRLSSPKSSGPKPQFQPKGSLIVRRIPRHQGR
jgi:hypothetical protein